MSLVKDVIGSGLHSDRPDAGNEGRLYYETDTATLFRDNGTNWMVLGNSKIGEVIVGSGGAADVSFPSIPGTFSELRLCARWLPDNTVDIPTLLMEINGDTTPAHYPQILVAGGAPAVGGGYVYSNALTVSVPAATCGWAGRVSTSLDPNAPGCSEVTLFDYASTLFHKVVQADFAAVFSGDYEHGRYTTWWQSTAPITELRLFPSGGAAFIEGSRFSLYGIA